MDGTISAYDRVRSTEDQGYCYAPFRCMNEDALLALNKTRRKLQGLLHVHFD